MIASEQAVKQSRTSALQRSTNGVPDIIQLSACPGYLHDMVIPANSAARRQDDMYPS